ncbi:TlpA disulfide reductase family protein [Paenibacillus sp. FSL M8-0334]|uniref:TlpA family protein disulfide reductase n=1 Tax=Paenibacillus sp. FSL M8-0334 TaxID=2921623 RepID=UPI0030F5CF83
MRGKWSLIGTGIILLAFIAAVLMVVTDYKAPAKSRESVAAQLTLNRLQDLEPVTVDFAEKPTVLLFFTSWCPYCQEDAPKMVTLHEKYKDQLNLYGINLAHRDEESEVKQYVQSFQIEYPILLDEDGEVYAQYAGNGFPSLYFFDSEGNVIQELVGATDIDTIEQLFVSFLEGYH